MSGALPGFLSGSAELQPIGRVYLVLADRPPRSPGMATAAVAIAAGVDVQVAARALELLELRGHAMNVNGGWRHVGRLE